MLRGFGKPTLSADVQGNLGWVLALSITFFALAVRLQGLDLYWLHADEGIYYEAAYAAPERFSEMVAHNAHPPLYYLMLRVLAWFGVGHVGMRAASAVCGAACVYLGFLLGRQVRGTTAGLAVAALIACSPGLMVLSQVVRSYSLQLLLSLATLWLWLRALERRTAAGWAMYGGAALAAVAVHYGSFVTVASTSAITVLVAVTAWRDRSDRRWLAATQVAIAAEVIALVVWHVLPDLYGTPMQRGAQEGWLREHFARDLGELWSNLVGAVGYLVPAPLVALVVVAIPCGLAAAWSSRRRIVQATVVGLALSCSLSVLRLYPLGPSRHSAHLAAFVLPAAGFLVGWLVARRWRWPLLAVAALGVWLGVLDRLLAVPAVPVNPGAAEASIRTDEIEPIRPALTKLRDRDQPGTLIVDSHTYGALAPVFAREHRMLPELAGVQYRASKWGACTIVRNVAWTMRAGSRYTEVPRHLAVLLRELADGSDAEQALLADVYVANVGVFRGAAGNLMTGILTFPRTGKERSAPLALVVNDNNLSVFRLDVPVYLERIASLREGR